MLLKKKKKIQIYSPYQNYEEILMEGNHHRGLESFAKKKKKSKHSHSPSNKIISTKPILFFY